VTKPFSPRELLARVQSAIRHTRKVYASELVTFDGVCLDFKRMVASFDGQAVELTHQEFKILKFFSQNARRVISREELMREAFGRSRESYPLPHGTPLGLQVYSLATAGNVGRDSAPSGELRYQCHSRNPSENRMATWTVPHHTVDGGTSVPDNQK